MFELGLIEIIQGRVKVHLTIASQMQPESPYERYISPVRYLENEQSVVLTFYIGVQNAHVGHI